MSDSRLISNYIVGPERAVVQVIERFGVRYLTWPPLLCACPLSALSLGDVFAQSVLEFSPTLESSGVEVLQLLASTPSIEKQIAYGHEVYLHAMALVTRGKGQVLSLLSERLLRARDRGDNEAVAMLHAHMEVFTRNHHQPSIADLAREALRTHKIGVLISSCEARFDEPTCCIAAGLALHLDGDKDHAQAFEQIRDQHVTYTSEDERVVTDLSPSAQAVAAAIGIAAPFSNGVHALLDILSVLPDFATTEPSP